MAEINKYEKAGRRGAVPYDYQNKMLHGLVI